jgi:hypothetical protein
LKDHPARNTEYRLQVLLPVPPARRTGVLNLSRPFFLAAVKRLSFGYALQLATHAYYCANVIQ